MVPDQAPTAARPRTPRTTVHTVSQEDRRHGTPLTPDAPAPPSGFTAQRRSLAPTPKSTPRGRRTDLCLTYTGDPLAGRERRHIQLSPHTFWGPVATRTMDVNKKGKIRNFMHHSQKGARLGETGGTCTRETSGVGTTCLTPTSVDGGGTCRPSTRPTPPVTASVPHRPPSRTVATGRPPTVLESPCPPLGRGTGPDKLRVYTWR